MQAALDARQKQRHSDQRQRMVTGLLHSNVSALVKGSRDSVETAAEVREIREMRPLTPGHARPKAMSSPVYGLQLTPRSPDEGSEDEARVDRQGTEGVAHKEADEEAVWPFGNRMRQRAGERAGGRSLSADRRWTGVTVGATGAAGAPVRTPSADRSFGRAAPARASSSDSAQGKMAPQPVWPFGTRMQQRIERRASGGTAAPCASAAELVGAVRQGAHDGPPHDQAGRPSSAPTRTPSAEGVGGAQARTVSRTPSGGRPPWRPSGSAAVAGEEREKASERDVQALARTPSLERLVSVSPLSRGVSDDFSQVDAAGGRAVIQPFEGEAATEKAQLEMRAPLQHMLDAITYAYGVDLTATAGEEGGCRKAVEPLSMPVIGKAMSDGVALCRLATCVQRVAQTKTSCLPLSPLSSTIRGWTLTPSNRSQRLNNLRIALETLRSDARVQILGHASHWSLLHPDHLEHGDPDAARNVICIVYDALARSFPLSPEKAKTGRSGHVSHTPLGSNETGQTRASPVRSAGNVGGDEPPAAVCVSVARSPDHAEHVGGDVTAVEFGRQRVSQPARRARSVSRSLSPAAARPPRSRSAAARGRPAGAGDAGAEQREWEDAEDTVIYHAPVQSERAHVPGQSCAEGCGGWAQVERLLAADRAQPALDAHFLDSVGNGALQRDARPSLQLQMHLCRWLVTLNLPVATPSLSRHEFANLSQAVDDASLLDDPLKNGCLLLHLAQVLRGQQPHTPPWCKTLGRPKTVVAVRKNVETALELVQPLLKASAAEHQGRELAVDVEALVAGDDVAIWTLLHRLRLASSRHGPLPGDTAGLPGGSEHGKGSMRGRHCRQVLPYSEEQVELLEAALVIWLSSVAHHVPTLRAVLPAPDEASSGYAQVNLVGSASRLLGVVLAEMHDSGGILLASVASLATGMPVRVMRSVKSHAVAVGNIRRICEQLGDMNHVGRRFLPFIPNITRGERHAMVLLLEELMRCAYSVAPGRKLTAKGNYARCTPSSSFSVSVNAPSKPREIPFLQPLTKSRVAAVARSSDAAAAAAAPLYQDAADDSSQGRGGMYGALAAGDLSRHRQFEQHQVWRHSIASAVKDLPVVTSSLLHSAFNAPETSASHETHETHAPLQGNFRYLEDLDAHLALTRAKSGSTKTPSARSRASRSPPPRDHADAAHASSRAGALRSQQMEAARAFVRGVQGAGTALAKEPASRPGNSNTGNKAKDHATRSDSNMHTNHNTNGNAAAAAPNSPEFCLRCIHWNGKRQRQPAPPLLGTRKSASSPGAGARSPYRIANSPPKSGEPVSPDDAGEVGRLREWMRTLKGGSVQWPESVMQCAPADFAASWSDGVALCLLAGALQPLAGRTLLQGWERRPRTRAHRAHNVRRALSVLGLQAKMHVSHVPLLLDTSSLSAHARADNRLLDTLNTTNGAMMGTLRGSQALLCDEAVLDGDASMVLALLRLVRLAYRRP